MNNSLLMPKVGFREKLNDIYKKKIEFHFAVEISFSIYKCVVYNAITYTLFPQITFRHYRLTSWKRIADTTLDQSRCVASTSLQRCVKVVCLL